MKLTLTTPNEIEIYRTLVGILIREMRCTLYALIKDDIEMHRIVGTTKRAGRNKGQYGYFVNDDGGLLLLIQQMKLRSLLDLGAGCGILLSVINNLTYCVAKGVEIEKRLVEISSRHFGGHVIENDILKLTKTYLKKYQAIYFWEPFAEGKLCKKFVKLLENKCSKGHILIYYSAGVTGGFLNKSKAFKRLNSQYRYDIYEKL